MLFCTQLVCCSPAPCQLLVCSQLLLVNCSSAARLLLVCCSPAARLLLICYSSAARLLHISCSYLLISCSFLLFSCSPAACLMHHTHYSRVLSAARLLFICSSSAPCSRVLSAARLLLVIGTILITQECCLLLVCCSFAARLHHAQGCCPTAGRRCPCKTDSAFRKLCTDQGYQKKTFSRCIVVFTQQKESSRKCLLCISIEQRIDNMYTQVAIHTLTIGSLAVSQFSPFSC